MADDGHSHLNSQHDNRRAPFPFNPSSNGLERAQSISNYEEGAIAPWEQQKRWRRSGLLGSAGLTLVGAGK